MYVGIYVFNASRQTIKTKSNRLLDRYSEVMGQCAKYGDKMAICQTNIPDKTLPTVVFNENHYHKRTNEAQRFILS